MHRDELYKLAETVDRIKNDNFDDNRDLSDLARVVGKLLLEVWHKQIDAEKEQGAK